MQETKQDLQNQLLECLKDQEEKMDALEETRELLKKADIKKKENPDERSRWSKTLDNLEAALFANKRALTIIDNRVMFLKRKLDRWNDVPIPDEVPPIVAENEPFQNESFPNSPSAPPSIQDRIDTIVQNALDMPLFKINEITQDEYRLLRAFLESPNSGKVHPNALNELKKRVSIIERSQTGTVSQSKANETPTQKISLPSSRNARIYNIPN